MSNGGDPEVGASAPRANDTRRLVRRIGLVLAGSFVFTFSMVPLYRIACEKVLGLKLEQGPAGQQQVAGVRQDPHREVTVEFDGNVNSSLPWGFHASKPTMKVHPGQLYDATYWAQNQSDHAIVGNAAPSITPSDASSYFHKTECFCFTQQTLLAGEQKLMPVRFYIDPQLPAGVDTVTLSYTFFTNEAATAALATGANAVAARNAP